MIRSLLIFFCAALMAEEEIVIRLPTQSTQTPIYVDSFEPALRRTLVSDLRNDGKSRVVEGKPAGMSFREAGILYTLDCQMEGEELLGTLTSTSSGNRSAMRVSADGQGMHQLADAIHLAVFGKPGIASTRLLYTVKAREASLSEVWACDYDGRHPERLTRTGTLCVTPSFLPPTPGKKTGTFFFVSYETGQSKIYSASMRGGTPRRFIDLKGNQLTPTVSAQRDKIAFISDAGGNPDLFLQAFSPETGPIGKPQQIFTARRAAQGSPCFSPDGKRLAFVSNKDGPPRIYLLDVPEAGVIADKPTPKMLTRHSSEATAPAWSPDGKKLAYSAKTDGTRQIWIYNLETGEERQLTEGHGHKENPSWAPDSFHLVFNSAGRTSCELYLANLGESKVTKITSGPGEKRFPVWIS
jgi:TolB protein